MQKLLASGYFFQTLQDFIQQPEDKTVILRHDVDRKPENALVIAKIEKDAGIKASYYFRIVKESYDENIIKKIAEMGHEIGYHYENLSEISRKKEGRISHRPTRTHTDVLAERLARIKMVIASRKKSQKKSSPRLNKCKNGFNWVNLAKKEKFRDELNGIRDAVTL